jgi:hypothetical protein
LLLLLSCTQEHWLWRKQLQPVRAQPEQALQVKLEGQVCVEGLSESQLRCWAAGGVGGWLRAALQPTPARTGGAGTAAWKFHFVVCLFV